ncbi:PREDICTED: protein FAR1-RELATED SEQUENCE 5-like [Nelumbo nucifera]|uniref:Protein FAR1-RELATED SEQUENCE 5-like n=1 Tax=Nelumbo nucifera TaxID=4432 RepID=A0A1U8A6H2_NELNU|nr:PREDICTED: protein FAR1-RELATED SEQUENCE 5-like [Nelumbo nucifera]
MVKLVMQENGKYYLTEFERGHNHQLVTPSKSCMLRSQRKTTIAQADLASGSSIRPKETLEFMGRQPGGIQNLGLTNEGARAMVRYFDKLHDENISSFHLVQLDEDNQITNIFWVDAKVLVDYDYFGDIIYFDTTFQTNEDKRAFAPFVRVNHHNKTTFFGAALMYDQSIESFKWVIQSFLRAISKKQPKTILTDQDPAMTNAIKQIFPKTCHRLCIWHIYQNAIQHLSNVFVASSSFDRDFSNCIYGHEDEDGFLTT